MTLMAQSAGGTLKVTAGLMDTESPSVTHTKTATVDTMAIRRKQPGLTLWEAANSTTGGSKTRDITNQQETGTRN